MAVAIRDVHEHELDAILALNNAAGPAVLPLDAPRIHWFYKHASYFRIAEVNGHLAGFLVALRENTSYDSVNYDWFKRHYATFVYISRIVVAKPHRGIGLGRILYCDAQSYAEARVPLLTCKVFIEPRDDVSMLFHSTYGFHEVGQQLMPGIERRVAFYAMELPSYTFVRETYLDKNKLPSLPWLTERLPTE